MLVFTRKRISPFCLLLRVLVSFLAGLLSAMDLGLNKGAHGERVQASQALLWPPSSLVTPGGSGLGGRQRPELTADWHPTT